MIFTYFLCLSLSSQYSFPYTTLNMDNLSLRKILTINESELSQESCFTFGIWSKYIPLNIKAFKYQIGMFESNCFQLINVMEYTTQNLNFIYYVCLDYSSKRIVKKIQFINDQDELIQIEQYIDPLEFENIWYQFQFISWPILRRLELIIIQSDKTILKEVLTDIKPLQEQQLLLIFGESLEVKKSKIDLIEQGMIFSLFPGQIVVYDPLIDIIPISFDFEQDIIEGYQNLEQCNCQSNEYVYQQDIQLNILDDQIYITDNVNCDFYSLNGWLRVLDVVQKSEEFTQQFMKITAYIGKQQLLNENLATFQMFYQLSPLQKTIVIKSYTYDFPIVTKESLDSIHDIETEFQIQMDIIQKWHYLFLELEGNQINIKITFYDGQSNIQFYETQIQVRQFQNCQFKLQYGNVVKDSLNYLNMEVRNLQFTICQQDLKITKCHSSCLDCNGPDKTHCLSCSAEQQRMYIPKFRQCICSYSTIDYDNKCITYEDSNLQLKVKQNHKRKCQPGYFELEGDCERCPSIVKNGLITCFECFSHVLDWASFSICENNLYIPISSEIPGSLFLTTTTQYYHDGSDLIICEYCYFLTGQKQELQNQKIIYELFLYNTRGFKSFRFSEMDFFEEERFSLCLIKYCKQCGFSIDRIVCLLCEKDYDIIDGLCKNTNKTPYIYQYCQPPYYASYNRECKICHITYCLYCFEYNYYNSEDLNSLSLLYIQISEDFQEFIKIGCMLCQDGYIFNFNMGLCVNQVPRIQYCLKSYVNKLEEQCLISTLSNFQISRIINDCDEFILNCQICALYYQKVILCVECKVGFEIQDGQCYMNEEFGINYFGDIQDLQVKAFLLIFQYSRILDSLDELYYNCGKSCLECKTYEQQYFCDQCAMDYMEEEIRFQYGLYCPVCPRNCQACKSRSLEDIKTMNPVFIITPENAIYTQQCLLPIIDPLIYYDPYLKITQVCFDGNCHNEFELEYYQQSCYLERFPKSLSFFNINSEYYNNVGVNTLTFKLYFEIYSDLCHIRPILRSRASLKEDVFTLNIVNLNLISLSPFFFTLTSIIKFEEYDNVTFINTGFIFSEELQYNILLLNSYNSIDFTMINCTIMNSSINNITSLFYAQQFGSINLQNFSITNTTIRNSSLFNLLLLQFKGQMTIVSLFIANCTFIDSQLFQFSKSLQNIQILNFTLDSCVFQNASLFNFYLNYIEETTFQLQNLSIQNNQFHKSYFLFCSQIINIDITNTVFNFNRVENSIIFGFSYSLFANYIQIKENVFIESQFLQTIEVSNSKNTHCSISELIVENNVFQSSNLIHIFSNSYSNKLLISITSVQIQQNIRSVNTDQSSQILNINCKSLELNNFFIRNNQQIRILNLYDSQEITLKNLIFENQIVQQKVSVSKNCLQSLNLQNQLILITGFDNIYIEKCKFIKQSSFDESLIEITSSKSKLLLGSIVIKNIEFYGNLLQLLSSVQSFSLLAILSDQQINVLMENVKYSNNFMHVYSESALKQSANLLYITSASSSISINNLDCIQNSMTNSSNSFIRITSKQLKLSNILIKNHNILSYNIWKDYYPIKIENEQDQEEINLFIMQIYHIKNIGGAAQIEASQFECLNCSFQEILVAKSSVFDIMTSNEGIVLISNFSVNSTKYSVVEQTESSGCLSLNSQNSLLSLSISSARFTNVINRMSTSILSVIPSLFQNKIIIQDVYILNCISLKNQIVHIQFINQIVALNSISFINIKIIQDQQAWATYFQLIGLMSLSEILEITGDENALIYLENCDFQIKNFIVEGILIYPVLKLINVQNLLIVYCYIENIVSITAQDLIQIRQQVQSKSLVQIRSLNIKRAHIYKSDPIPQVQPPKFQADYFIVGCLIMNNSYLIEQPEDFLYKNILQLQQSNYQQNSIIFIQSQSNLSTFLLEQIKLEHNNFQTGLNGIIYFDVALFYKLQINNLDCNYNFIQNYGCLQFVGNNSVVSKIQIKDSNFINNNGSKGVAIKITDISLDLKYCKITSNIATTQGGALYLGITSKIFRIVKTIIINNEAQEGGGIYFEKDLNLNKKNFHNSLLLFNKAQNYGNNLVENPTHLSLFINSKEMTAEIYEQDNVSTCVLKIQPYKIIEQGKYVETQQFMIPSNQEINAYQLFILKGSIYVSYIKKMSLFFKNSKGELLFNLSSSTCQVSNVFIKNDGQQVIGLTKNQTLSYESINNNFELGTLAFSLNPYELDYSHLKIQVYCKTQYSYKEFRYIINAKSLKCQLGEFYIENGCQICSWTQGFYSVTYNAIKCAIYDKQKFQNITSNMINLYEGYWRPNYLSDHTESCYKNSQFCQGGWGVGDTTCKLGHKGALCEMCDVYNEKGDGKFFKDQQNFSCQSCSKNYNIVLPFLFALFQSLLSITLSLKSINKSNQLFSSLKIFVKFSKLIFKLSQDHEGILVKMLLNYLWIFSVIFTFNINFSISFIFIEQSSNSFYFMVNNLDCYLSDLQLQLIYIKIFVILILMILQFNLILALSLLYHSITKNNMDNSLLSNTLLYLYVFNYGGLIKMLCSTLSGRQISNINYIQGDVSLLYDTSDHQLWIYCLILPLLVVYGCIIPFSLFLLTYVKRDILHKIKLRKHICYLFNEYTDNNYYWEQIKLLQKAIIILITTYFENNILLKTSLLGLCLLSYQAMAVKNKPYIISKFNNLDLSSGQICSITIFLAATKYESQNLNNQFFSVFLQIVILLLLVRLCYPFLLNIFTVYYKKYSIFILTKIHQFLKYLNLNKQCVQFLGDYLIKDMERKQRLKSNFLKLKEFLIPKSKAQSSYTRTATRKIHFRSTSNSGLYFVDPMND